MLKPEGVSETNEGETQPPSGGCVLKRFTVSNAVFFGHPAAFRRLCVETRRCGTGFRPAASRLQAAVC